MKKKNNEDKRIKLQLNEEANKLFLDLLKMYVDKDELDGYILNSVSFDFTFKE